MILLAFLILTFPTDFELYRERKGEDPTKKGRSMTVRAVLMIVCALIAATVLEHAFHITDLGLWMLTYLKCLFLSFAIFILFFNPLINLILGREPWYSYLSKSRLDMLASKVDWRLRMVIRVAVFVIALWFFSL